MMMVRRWTWAPTARVMGVTVGPVPTPRTATMVAVVAVIIIIVLMAMRAASATDRRMVVPVIVVYHDGSGTFSV